MHGKPASIMNLELLPALPQGFGLAILRNQALIHGEDTMADMTRRNVIQGTLAGISAVGVGGALPALAVPPKPAKVGFKLCELWNNPQASEITIAKQIGVTHVITSGGLGRIRKEDYAAAALKHKATWEAV